MEFICQFIANLVIVSQSMKPGPVKLMGGPRDTVTNQGPALWETSPEWRLRVPGSPVLTCLWLKPFPATIFCDSRASRLLLRGSTSGLPGLGVQSHQESRGHEERQALDIFFWKQPPKEDLRDIFGNRLLDLSHSAFSSYFSKLEKLGIFLMPWERLLS